MRRGWPIGLATLIVPFLLACPSEPPAGDHHDFPPPVDAPKLDTHGCTDSKWVPDEPTDRCLVLQTFVESRLGPYEVFISIAGGNGTYPNHLPIAAGGWKHTLKYRTGVKMLLTLHFELEKEGSTDGFCSITDGPNTPVRDDIRPAQKTGGPPWIAVCTVTTNQ